MARKTDRVFQTTQEDIEKINPDNIALLDDFIEYYIATDHSPKSVVVTKSNLLIFFTYVLKNLKNRHFAKLKRKDYLQYQSFLLSNGLSPSRIRALKSSISSLSLYVEHMVLDDLEEDDDEYEVWKKWKNVINSIPSPKNEAVRKKTVLEDEDVQKLLDMLVEQKKYQHACALALAWASGSRKSELVLFKKDFFDAKHTIFDGALWLTPEPIRTKGAGVNGKQLQRYVLVSKFKKYLDLWLEERERLGIESEWLFVKKNRYGYQQMKESTLTSYTNLFSKILKCDFYFHCMRHQFVTSLIELGLPSQAVVEIIGWSSDLTSIYNDKKGTQTLSKFFNGGEIVAPQQKSLADL